MALNHNILNYLSTPQEFATPQQIEDVHSLAKAYEPSKPAEIHHLAQGADYILRALMSSQMKQATYREHEGSNNLLINSLTGQTAPPRSAPIAAAPGMLNAPAIKQADTDGGGGPKGGYATIRNNNPGGQWPGPSATKFGATGHQNLADGNKIATFATPEAGAAATFDLLATRYAGKPVVQALARWKGGNVRDAAAVAQKLGMDPNAIITPQMLSGPEGIAFVKEIANSEAPVPFPLDDSGWAKAQQMAFGGDSQIPVAGAQPALKAPIQVASADGSIPESALPPELSNLGTSPSGLGGPPPPVETAALPPVGEPDMAGASGNAAPAPTMPDAAAGSIPPANNSPSKTAQNNYMPSSSADIAGLEHKLPPPPPSGLGLSAQMWHAGQQNPELFGSLVSKLQAAYSPIMNEVEGGTAWVIPATGERGLIPKPKFDTIEAAGVKLPTVSRVGPNGQMQAPEVRMPNFGGGNGASGPAGNGGMAPNNGIPGEQGSNVTAPTIYDTPSLNSVHSMDDLVKYTQKAEAAKGAINAASTKGNEILIAPMESAIESGAAATKTLEVMKALEGMETLDATQGIRTGPWAEKFVKIDQALTDMGFSPMFNTEPGSLTAAQALGKLGVFLTTQSTKELTSRPAVAEFMKYLETNPSTLVSPDARRTLINYLKQSSTQTKALGEAASNALVQGRDGIIRWNNIKNDVMKQHPINVDLNVPKTNPAALNAPGAAKRKVWNPTKGIAE